MDSKPTAPESGDPEADAKAEADVEPDVEPVPAAGESAPQPDQSEPAVEPAVEQAVDPAAEEAAEVVAASGPGAADAEPAPEPDAEPTPEPAPEAKPEPEAGSEPAARPAVDRGAGRRRLQAALWPPRLSRGQLVVALLLFSLGLGLAIQVRSTNDHHSQLRGARQEDLVRILDELDGRQQRLQQEKAELEQSLAKLENSSNQAKEAQEQTRKKVTELGVLAGTVKATGPGIVLTVDDPQGQVKADMLLDTLQELRAAGAEAIQINDVRVVVNTYFTDASGGGVQIDGKKVSQPYRFTVVGNPQDLTPALNIPGGVVRTLESHQARATISQQQKVVVDALVDLKTPQYAKPAPK
ncbi:DUF881 domain-containing protein [Kitasatospora sp. NPDC048239]|uniref:DUF881 domain-containing protein n=1 Tax=Kitasatospora sp. NPDC048239 TaxID=3364046 RepID=UPI0037185460